MNIIAYDLYKRYDLAKKFGFKYVSLNDLLKKSDIVTLHVPLTNDNHHLINKNTLKLMKNGAFLINTSRGEIVDTAALLEFLGNGRLGGAGLDVIEGEEMIKEEKELLLAKKINVKKMHQLSIDNKIMRNEKVVFTPHIAFYSEEAIHRIIEITIENIDSFVKKKLINIVI